MKMRFPNEVFEIEPTNVGSGIITIHEFNEDTGELENLGEFDMQAYINSFESESDITKLVERYKAGDSQALNRVQKIYGDVTEIPTHLGDALELTKAVNFAQVAYKTREANNQAQNVTNVASQEGDDK